MSDCQSCDHWTLARITEYADGTKVEAFRAPAGKGHCEELSIDTSPNFGCLSHCHADHAHVFITQKDGAPWQHWKMGPCPDCKARGNENDGACHRCAGTSKVRHYEDGYVGEERTRLHPKERESAAKPKCLTCSREVEPDWMACPKCGARLDAAAQVEKVDDPLFVANG